jgi:hypothetical protein
MLVLVGICLAVGSAHAAESAQRVSDVAKPSRLPDGAPRYSDVSMRLFRPHPGDAEIEAGKAYHITRADWSYVADADYIRRVQALGWRFSGTMNAITFNETFALRDKQGRPIQDHFKIDGRYVADPDHPGYRDGYFAQAQRWIDLGVYVLQRDETNGLRRWSTEQCDAFYTDLHRRIDAYAGRHVAWSCNMMWNGSQYRPEDEPITRHFDYGMSELNASNINAAFFAAASRQTRQRGGAMLYTGTRAAEASIFRRAVAGCYATGLNFIVPWDQYAGAHQPRVFIEPSELADLYGFVRAIGPLLDGYEDAASCGPGLDDPRWDGSPPVRFESGSGKQTAFVRARPDVPSAPVVIHVIDWADQSQPGMIVLDRAAFFSDAPIKIRLIEPVPYKKDLHRHVHHEAEQRRQPGAFHGPELAEAYAPLQHITELPASPAGEPLTVSLPALNPWAIVLIEPTQ